jgi:hypothetical protein
MARIHLPLILLLLPWLAWAQEVVMGRDVPLQDFATYSDEAPPEVPPRKESLTFYPCSQCHEHWRTNPAPRPLAPVHDVGLKHGEGRIWCLDCHDPDERDRLHTLHGTKVDFDEAWRLCGQCHSARQKDWYFGAHGKRVETWQGEARRYNCTHCHNPHRPPFMRRKPMPPPPVRAGLKPMKQAERHPIPIWQRPVVRRTEDSSER